MVVFGIEWGVTEILVLLITLGIFIHFLLNKRPRNFPNGPRRLPIVGNLHQLSYEPHKTFMEMGEKYGDIFSIYFGGFPGIVINDLKLIKEAFAEPVFNGRASFLKAFAARTGGVPRGVIFTHGKVWMEQRRFVLKTLRDFGFGKKSMEHMVYDEVNELIETFKKTSGEPIQTQNIFNAAVLNALWSLVAGKRYSHDDPVMQDLIKRMTITVAQSRAAGLILFFPFLFTLRKYVPWLFGAATVKDRQETHEKTIQFMKDQIEEHQSTFQPDAVPRDFIDVYLAEMKKVPQDSSMHGEEGILNLTYTLIDLFLAGAETTSTTLSWMFLLLALNPEPQEKFYQEVKKVVGTSRLPSLNDKPNMPYTEAVILETMRFSAMVPIGVFHSTIEDTTFHEYEIPKNTIVVANLYKCMKDPKIWGDPNVFRPERFLSPDGTTVMKHEALIPFSTGRRVCLGEALARDELFLFASSLFQRFRVTPDPDGPELSIEYHLAAVLIPKPHNLVVYDRHDDE